MLDEDEGGMRVHLVSTEEVSLTVDGIRLVGELYLPGGSDRGPALCICHGIPANGSPDPTDKGYSLLAEEFCSHGFAVLIFNFRGSGRSGGNFDMMGWTRDLHGAVDLLCGLDMVDKAQVSIMGFSGGAAAAVYCAARDNRISALVTCACPTGFLNITDFKRIEDFVKHCREIGIIRDRDFPPSVEEWGNGFVEISPIEWIDRISPRPLLILHGAEDTTVDPDHARSLYDKAGEPKEISIIEGGGHKLRLNKKTVATALAWLKSINGLS